MPEEYVGKPDVGEMGEDYVGQPVGDEYETHGLLCERPGAQGICHLTPTQRQARLHELDRYSSMAATAYHAAVENARIDELLKKAPQLGLVAELLIGALGVVTGTLLNGAVSKALHSLAERAVAKGAMKAADVVGTVTAQAGHIRNVIAEAIGISKGRAKIALVGPTPQSAVRNAFLKKMQNQINPTLNLIVKGVLNTGDDFALVTAVHLFDPDVFTTEACSTHVEEMLTRLESQHIDDIGSINAGAVHDVGTTEVVRLQSWGKHRLAVVKFAQLKKLGRIGSEDLHQLPGTEFVNWIDDDFGDFATSVQDSRHGAMQTIDVSAGHRFGPEVQSWVERTTKGASR